MKLYLISIIAISLSGLTSCFEPEPTSSVNNDFCANKIMPFLKRKLALEEMKPIKGSDIPSTLILTGERIADVAFKGDTFFVRSKGKVQLKGVMAQSSVTVAYQQINATESTANLRVACSPKSCLKMVEVTMEIGTSKADDVRKLDATLKAGPTLKLDPAGFEAKTGFKLSVSSDNPKPKFCPVSHVGFNCRLPHAEAALLLNEMGKLVSAARVKIDDNSFFYLQ